MSNRDAAARILTQLNRYPDGVIVVISRDGHLVKGLAVADEHGNFETPPSTVPSEDIALPARILGQEWSIDGLMAALDTLTPTS